MAATRFGPYKVETQSGESLQAGVPVEVLANVAGASVASVIFPGGGAVGTVASGGFPGMVVGAPVSGTGVPPGLTVASIVSNTITLQSGDVGGPAPVVAAGTITLKTADSVGAAATLFSDDSGSVSLTNPVTTDDNGEITFVIGAPADVWLSPTGGENKPQKVQVH